MPFGGGSLPSGRYVQPKHRCDRLRLKQKSWRETIPPVRMANYEISYSARAREDLDRFSSRQAGQIVKKIGRLQSGLHGDIKRLQQHDVSYRLRMGDYRVLFDVVGGSYHHSQNQRPGRCV